MFKYFQIKKPCIKAKFVFQSSSFKKPLVFSNSFNYAVTKEQTEKNEELPKPVPGQISKLSNGIEQTTGAAASLLELFFKY